MKHLYYWNEQDEQWEHSCVCWCKVKNADKETLRDIRTVMGSIAETNTEYRWFDRNTNDFTLPKDFSVSLRAELTEFVRAENEDDAMILAKGKIAGHLRGIADDLDNTISLGKLVSWLKVKER